MEKTGTQEAGGRKGTMPRSRTERTRRATAPVASNEPIGLAGYKDNDDGLVVVAAARRNAAQKVVDDEQQQHQWITVSW